MYSRVFTTESCVDIEIDIYEIQEWVKEYGIEIDELFNEDIIEEYFQDNFSNNFNQNVLKNIKDTIPMLSLEEMEEVKKEAEYYIEHYKKLRDV
jgi:hypothetical protein